MCLNATFPASAAPMFSTILIAIAPPAMRRR